MKTIKRIYIKFRTELIPKFFSTNKFLASFYYAFISNSFKREHYSVLKGKIKYLEDIKNDNSNYTLLVRNTHRIEKGLLMKPRRDVFALDYITETTIAYNKIIHSKSYDNNNPQIQWFHDVLKEYFDLVKTEKTAKSKKLFNETNIDLNQFSSNKKIPYVREESQKSNISFEDFYRLNKYRRSVRWYKDKKVPRELIEKAITLGLQAPSACNRQPFEYYVVDSPELKKEAVSLPMGSKGYSHTIPTFIVIVGNLDAYFSERDRHVIYIDASLASMSIMLALETLELSSCPINWPDIEHLEKKMEQFLKLKNHQRPIMCLAVGYPDEESTVAYSEKKDYKSLINYL